MRRLSSPSFRVAVIAVLGAAMACATAAPVSTAPTPISTTTSVSSAAPAVNVSTPPTYRKEFGTMWTFDAPPLNYWKQTYNFTPPAGWLDHIRLSAVRLPGCSASFVSSEGLVMTNHHCARDCTAEVSPRDTNYITTGFAAKTLADEKKCTGMTVDQLQSIEDITPQIQSAVTGTTDSAQAEERAVVIAGIQKDCSAKSGLMCQVVTLYNGGRYSLYRYKRFTDVRLVMAPEGSAAFFGGDPDNFTYPRYDLDLTLLRVYENGAPFKPTNYLKWSAAGAQANELVFVIGNPGSTERLSTVAQLEYNRDVGYPMTLASYVRNLTLFREDSAKSPELARAYQNQIFEYENSYKAVSGFLRGLRDSSLMAQKRGFEAEVRARVAANPKWQAEYGGAWTAIAKAVREQREITPRLTYYFGGQTPIFVLGRYVVRAGMAPASDTALARIRMALMRPQPMDTFKADFLTRGLVLQLHDAIRTLPANDPYLALVLKGETPEVAAQRLIQGTKVQNVQFRTALLQGGASAIAASTDPIIALFRHADSLEQPLRERAERANAIIATNSAAIGRALYEVYGTILPPDATFTLRISDGVVKGYPMNGTIAPYKTSIYGLFARSAEFDDVAPFQLPDRWVAARNKVDMTTPADFVSTNDIIGGNSGSPVINRNGEVVGLIFDGNIESLPNRFVFTDDVARSVSVHSRFITEALRNVYNATRIANELEGKGPAGGTK